MIISILICILAFVGGAWLGKKLAAIGITSDNALQNHQKLLTWLLLAIALWLGILIVIDKFNFASLLPQIFPPLLLIYIGGYFSQIIVGVGCFALGLAIALELSGKRSRQKMRQLLVAVGAITLALSLLLFFLQPVQALLEPAKIINGVVHQTTLFTCAPASIATLARYTKQHPQLTEKDVVQLTKTNRFGTTTLAEIRAMEKLQLNPQYKHNLTIQDLTELNRPALLHVKEKNKNNEGVRFSHAVALLKIDRERELIVIGNPLYGLQIKTFQEMQGYWYGEAILVGKS